MEFSLILVPSLFISLLVGLIIQDTVRRQRRYHRRIFDFEDLS